MDSIGEKLRSIREQKKITIRDVSKDTNISASYIQALEDEDFDKFPGETYIIGFLRSYSEYLKLDPEEMIQAYKGYKIGESATPLEELTKPTHSVISMDINSFYSKYRKILNFSIVGVVFLIVIIIISQLSSPDIDIDENTTKENIKKQYSENQNNDGYDKILGMDIDSKTRKGSVSATRNNAVQFRVDSKEIMFILKDVTKDSVQLEFLLGKQQKQTEILMVAQPKVIKLSGISRDLTFNLQAATANEAKINLILGQTSDNINNGTQTDNNQQTENLALSTSMVALNPDSLRILLKATFIEKTYLDLYLDGKKMTSELVHKGEHREWQAKQTIQAKVGNAGGMKVNINNKDFIFGQKGKVVHKIVTWKKDNKNPNLYHIIVKDL